MYTVLVNLHSANSHALEVSKRSEAVPLPFKPTSNMLAAGAKAGDVTPDIAWRIYRAMLNAARIDFATSPLG
ncbi:hypothetical protein QFZ27_001597 [Inquilinus ginsengisoli]|uniref:hypothetical protein n=1 Tax=Inquilinus ginsengisoli TaxID=363840 RepID=UPI003D22BA3F